MQLNRRTLMVPASLVLAFVATVVLISYVRGVERRTLDGAEPVEVYVAKETIPAGTPATAVVDRGLAARKRLPRAAVADGAVLSVDEIRDSVTVATILRGEPLLTARFSRGAARGVLPIPPERQAMTVELAVPPGVGGFVQPGDRISIVAQLDTPRGSGEKQPRVQYLLQDVPVLSVGQRVVTDAPKDGKATQVDQQQKVLVTLALQPAEVEKLAFAIFQGQIYATLLPPEGTSVQTAGRTSDNAFAQP